MGRSDFLFVMPNLLNGCARTLDLAGLYDSGSYNESASPEEADAWAISSDWFVVGDDLARAIRERKTETIKK